jgi:protein SCO1/2
VNNSSRLILAGVCILMAAIGFGASHLWKRSHGPARVTLLTGTLLEPRRSISDFSLLDHHGSAFTPQSLKGRWSMLFFGYTNCPDLCPTTLSALAAMDKSLQGEQAAVRPQVVFVSVDARRDTPAVLARYVPYFNPAFLGVTAPDQATVETFARHLGVSVLIGEEHDGTYGVDHSGAIFVVAPDGRIAAILTGPHSNAGLLEDFHRIVAART